MTTAREIMTGGVECAATSDTLVEAAKKLRDLGVGALPICGEDRKLAGMLTDRDIVVRCIAEGGDPSTMTAGDLAEGKPVTIGADDSVEETLRTVSEYAVRRLPDGSVMVATQVPLTPISMQQLHTPHPGHGEAVEKATAVSSSNMSESNLPPLPNWGRSARVVFPYAFVAVGVLGIISNLTRLDIYDPFWLALVILVGAVWTLSLSAWTVAEFLRGWRSDEAEY